MTTTIETVIPRNLVRALLDNDEKVIAFGYGKSYPVKFINHPYPFQLGNEVHPILPEVFRYSVEDTLPDSLEPVTQGTAALLLSQGQKVYTKNSTSFQRVLYWPEKQDTFIVEGQPFNDNLPNLTYYTPPKDSLTTNEALTHLTSHNDLLYGTTSAGKYLLHKSQTHLVCHSITSTKYVPTPIPLDATWFITLPPAQSTAVNITATAKEALEALKKEVQTIRKTWKGTLYIDWTITPQDPSLTTTEALTRVLANPPGAITLYGGITSSQYYTLSRDSFSLLCGTYSGPDNIPVDATWRTSKEVIPPVTGSGIIYDDTLPLPLEKCQHLSNPSSIVTLQATLQSTSRQTNPPCNTIQIPIDLSH